MRRNWVTATLFLAIGVCLMDNNEAKSDIPKLKHQLEAPVIKFLICISWGYRRASEEYAQILKQRYSGIQIEAGNFPPSKPYQLIASVLSIVKFVLIGCILSGINPFDFLNIPTPAFYAWARENMIYACLMIFFLSNSIETQLMSTGAFEIMLNDVTIWSKLTSGRIPRMDELVQIIDTEMSTDSSFKSL